MSSAAMVSRRMRLSAKATSSGIARVEVVADHQHVEMLVDGVDRVGPRRVGRRGQHVRQRRTTLMMSGAWPPPAPSVWIGVDGAALEGGERVLDEAGLVQRVGVDRHLHVDARRPPQAAVDGRRRRAPVLVQLQAAWRRPRPARRAPPAALALPLPRKPRFIGKASAACSMRREVPGAGRAGGGVGAGGRAGAAAEHGGDAATSAPRRSAAGR